MIELSSEERYRVWLYDALRANAPRMASLLDEFGDAKGVYERAAAGEFIGNKDRLLAGMKERAVQTRIDDILSSYESKKIIPVSLINENYPKLLREIYDPPQMLFVKGRLEGDIPLPLALIGSRKCSSYGRETARRFGRELAAAGCCIVSGLAYGADVTAARGALESESDYPTVAVLGCGADVIYPQSSKKDYAAIAERGAVISEYLPGTPPLRSNFPQRNRIISGMTRGTIVVEAGERSGTSITINFALEQGRDVFAVPGRICDAQSVGTNRAIRDGYAKAVLGCEDILCEYGRHVPMAARSKTDISKLPEEQKKIISILTGGEKNFDELCILSAISPQSLNSVLTVMEFSGIIRQMSGRMYTL